MPPQLLVLPGGCELLELVLAIYKCMKGFRVMNFWTTFFLGNSLICWGVALGVGLFVFLLLRVIIALLKKRVSASAARPQVEVADLISGLLKATSSIFVTWLAISTATRMLSLGESLVGYIRTITIMLLLFQVGMWSIQIIEFAFKRRLSNGDQEAANRINTFSAIALVAKVIVWILVVALALDNIPGVDVTSLIAGLGIGGIAIGLAVQSILSDLFSSLTISLDQPFMVGDFINVGDFSGTVEHIGLKSTRIRSLTGEQLIFANSDLLSSRIRNYKRMQRRLVVFSLGVTYQTSYEILQEIPKMIQKIVETQEPVTFGRAHFKSYGDSSLNFEVVYFVESPDFNLYMDIQQNINLEIYRQFQDKGIDFAYPTQTIIIENQSLQEKAAEKAPEQV